MQAPQPLRLPTLLGALLLSCFIFLLTGCQSKERGEHELIIGTMAGPETELVRTAAAIAKKTSNLDVTVMEFEDYVTPNAALAEGSIDANLFQHRPFLEKTIAARHYPIVEIGRAFIYPMGLYSRQWKTLSDLPTGARIAIPIDPSNNGRALRLLAQAGLITLKPSAGLYPTDQDILENPRQLRIQALDAATMPRILTDVDLAAINTNFAIPAGLKPNQDALFLEPKDSPYANILVVRTNEQTLLKYQQLLEAIHSPEVLERAKALFSDQAIAAW